MTAKDGANLHAKHRERLKKRFLSEGLDHFEAHNILELILFYALARRDTNDVAHALLNRFGSLSKVLEASVQDLCQVEGIGEHAAILLKTYPAAAKRYYEDRHRKSAEKMDYKDMGEKLILRFASLDHEEVFAMFFNNSLSPSGETVLHQGDINSAGFSLRKLADAAVRYQASFVLLAHNHPRGMPIASGDDLHTTNVIRSFLGQMNVTLIDHFIVAENRFSSIDKANFCQITEEFQLKSRST